MAAEGHASLEEDVGSRLSCRTEVWISVILAVLAAQIRDLVWRQEDNDRLCCGKGVVEYFANVRGTLSCELDGLTPLQWPQPDRAKELEQGISCSQVAPVNDENGLGIWKITAHNVTIITNACSFIHSDDDGPAEGAAAL